ncbi:MAG TPA: hypothetical protein VKP13_18935 [Nitrospira sp.]|nr:hypothetical protein [Nitrospira sp.]
MPSTILHKWFGHDSATWAEWRRRYRVELRSSGQMEVLKDLV